MRPGSLFGAVIVLGAATLLPRADAEPPAVQTVFGTLRVDLRDGSRLVGRPDVEALLVKTAIGTTEVPLASIESLETMDLAGTAVIELRDGARLEGKVRPNPLTLQTFVGEVNIPLSEVVVCSVELAVTSEGNVALSKRGAKVRGVFDGNSGPALIDGNTTEYGGIPGAAHGASHGSAHVVGLPPSWVVELPQTYLLREIRVLLWDRDRRFYRYAVETSVDGRIYRSAADRSQGEWRSLQKLAFSPRPVRYIRLRGLYSSRLKGPNGMHVVELEAYCHPPRDGRLILWNTLGSKKEIYESEVGPGGTYSGEGGRFVEGRFGKALSGTAKEIHYQQPALVTFPKEVISTDAGCVEVWAKLDDFPLALKSGENPALFKIHDGTCSYIMHLNANDGASKGGLCGRAGGNSSAGTGVFGTWTYEQVLGTGQVERWHHYALVWDKDGIPNVDDGTRTIALFLDGKLNSQQWRTGAKPWVNQLTGGELRLLLNHHLAQGRVVLDNLKIWNYAKTDFSDRFVEGISPGLAGALTDPPGEFQVDYAGLRWDLMRTGWKVEDGRLASQRYPRPGFRYGHSANGRNALAITGIGDKSWTDYEVAFDFKMLPANREFFHAHIPGDSRGMSVVFRAKLLSESWNQPHTCYSFGLRPTGSWSVGVAEDYYMPGDGWSATRKGKTEKLANGKSESCKDASEGRLKLRVKDNTITVWLNDEKLIEHAHKGAVVDPIRYGGFGVGWRYESMGWISNLEVKKL